LVVVGIVDISSVADATAVAIQDAVGSCNVVPVGF
jgi:hypothetical protein